MKDSIGYYVIRQADDDLLKEFFKEYKIDISTSFEKILIELGIKNGIRKSLLGSNTPLPIGTQSFSNKQFFAIYVRNPKSKEQPADAVAVEFLYKEGGIYIIIVMRDVQAIKERFPILKSRKKDADQLVGGQQYFVDETDQIYISCYTDSLYTPLLIGRMDMDEMEKDTLKINRKKHNLLPLILQYNSKIAQVKNLVCLDLKNNSQSSLLQKIAKVFIEN